MRYRHSARRAPAHCCAISQLGRLPALITPAAAGLAALAGMAAVVALWLAGPRPTQTDTRVPPAVSAALFSPLIRASAPVAADQTQTALLGRDTLAVCTQPPPHCQAADQLGHGSGQVVGVLSDLFLNTAAAEDFSLLTAAPPLTEVCWRGFYFDTVLQQNCPAPPPHQVRVTYFFDQAGLPGPIVGGPFIGAAQRQLTGAIIWSGAGPLQEWDFRMLHPPVSLPAGGCYWVEIVALSPGPCAMGWSTSPQGDNASLLTQPGPYTYADYRDFDLAWCTLRPLLLPPPNCAQPPGGGEQLLADPWRPSIFDLDWSCSGVSRAPVVDIRGRVRDLVPDPLPTSEIGENPVEPGSVDPRTGGPITQDRRTPRRTVTTSGPPAPRPGTTTTSGGTTGTPVGRTVSGRPESSGTGPSGTFKDCGPSKLLSSTQLSTTPTYQSPLTVTTPTSTTRCNALDVGLGIGWNPATSACVQDPATGDVAMLARDSTVHVFRASGGEYEPSSAAPCTLVGDATTLLARHHNGVVFTYERMTPAIPLPGNAYLLTTIADPNGRTTTYSYSAGRLVQITDPEGRQIVLTHHPDGHIATMSDGLGRTVQFEYTGSDLTAIHMPGGEVLAYTYDADHVMTSKTVPGGDTYQVVYTPTERAVLGPGGEPFYQLSNLAGWNVDLSASLATRELTLLAGSVTLVDGRGYPWQYDYDLFGQVYHVTDPLGHSAGAGWLHNVRKMVSLVDRNGHVTQYGYDPRGNLTQMTDPAGNTWLMQYDPLYSRLTRMSEPDGDTWRYTYDSRGNLLEIIDPLVESPSDHTVRFEYDLAGRLVRSTDRNGTDTTYEYTNGLVTAEHVDPDGLNITYTYVYDAVGRRVSATDPVGTMYTYSYDARNRLLQEIVDPGAPPHLNLTTSYAYDGRGRLVAMTDPRGLVTAYAYDTRDRVTQIVRDPGGQGDATSFAYDGNGNLVAVTDALGGVTTHTYDGLNRLVATTGPDGATHSYTYDAERNVLTETDAAGHVTAYAYDVLDRVVQVVVDPGGLALTSTLEYAGAGCGCGTPGVGLVHKSVDAAGHVAYFLYDPLDRVTRVIRKLNDTADNGGDDDDAITDVTRDPVGRVTQIRVHNAPYPDEVAAFTYDAAGRQTALTLDPGGINLVRTVTYDAAGQPVARTEFTGQTLNLLWDAGGRVRTVSDAQGLLLAATYDALGNVLSLSDANGHARQFQYDTLGRLLTELDALGHATQYEYDALDRLVRRQDRLGRATQYAYDSTSRLRQIITPLTAPSPTTTLTYDALGRLISRTDASGGTTTYSYDAADRLVRTTYPDGGQLGLTYGSGSQPLERRNPNGDRTLYLYDDLQRPVQVAYVLAPGSPAAPTPTATYSYDRAGHLRTAVNAHTAVNYLYDALGRIARITRNGLHVDYTYAVGGGGTARSLTYPSGLVVTEQRDARDRLTQILDGAVPLATYAYDGANRLQTRTLANGTTTEYTLDGNRWAARIRHAFGPTALVDLEYGRDAEGNPLYVRKHHDPANSELYAYDALQRLVYFERGLLNAGGTAIIARSPLAGPIQAQQWSQLDPLGNWRETRITIDGLTAARRSAVNPANGYTHVGGRLQQHDANGNLTLDSAYGDADGDGDIDTSDLAALATCLAGPDNGLGDSCGPLDAEADDDVDVRDVRGSQAAARGAAVLAAGVRRYVYDVENRLVQVASGDGTIVQYAYDALGRRVRRTQGSTVTTYLYDAYIRVLEERTGAGLLVARYVYGQHVDDVVALDRGGQRYYTHRDALGSTAALTDAGGQVIERYLYDPYGKPFVTDAVGALRPASIVANPSLFTGRWYDAAVGLYDYRARTYDPEQGRFLSRDPLDYADGDNLYAYVLGRPTALTDALGLKCTGEACVKVEYKLEKKTGQKRIGPITFELSLSFTLEGSACKKCCPEDTQRPCDIVTDYDVTAKGQGTAEASGSSSGGKIDTIVFGEVEWWAGIKVTLTLTFGARGSIKSDYCNNKPACGEVAVFGSGSLAVSGGGEVKYKAWWGEARLGADVTGTGTVRAEIKYKCCLPPLKCEKIKGEVCLEFSADINVSVVFWSGSFNLFKADKCWEF